MQIENIKKFIHFSNLFEKQENIIALLLYAIKIFKSKSINWEIRNLKIEIIFESLY